MMPYIEIGSRRIGPGEPVYVVAEMSCNHHRDFDQAGCLHQTWCSIFASREGLILPVSPNAIQTHFIEVSTHLFCKGLNVFLHSAFSVQDTNQNVDLCTRLNESNIGKSYVIHQGEIWPDQEDFMPLVHWHQKDFYASSHQLACQQHHPIQVTHWMVYDEADPFHHADAIVTLPYQVPTERCTTFDIVTYTFAQHSSMVFGGQPHAGPDGSHILFGKDLSCLHVFDHEQ